MKQPLIKPNLGENDPELQKLIEFYEETLGFCPNSIKTIVPDWVLGAGLSKIMRHGKVALPEVKTGSG